MFFLIDPHGYRGIFSIPAEAFLFWFPLLIRLNVAFLVMLYWVELQNMKGLDRNLTSVQKYKPVLIIGAIASSVILLPLGLANALVYSTAINFALNGALAFILISLVIFSTYFGMRMLKILREFKNIGSEFMKKVCKLLKIKILEISILTFKINKFIYFSKIN